MCKMPNREHRETVETTIDALFESASSKIGDENSKLVLANLRKLVG